MGQAIVYCSSCNAQLRDADFVKGKAHRIEHKIYCRKCLPAGYEPPPPTEKTAALRRQYGVTTTAGLKAVKAETPKSSSKIPLIAGVAGGVLVVVLVLIVLFSGPPPRPGHEPEPEPVRPTAAPALPPAELAARDAHARLHKRIAESPDDLDGQKALFDDFARRAPGTSLASEVDLERTRLDQRRKDRRALEMAEVEKQVRESTEEQAAIFLKAVRNRHPDAAWTEAIDRLLGAVEPKPAAPVAAPAPPVAPKPAPKPATPAPPAAPVFPPGWEAALRHATARDYAAAQAALEKSPDAALVKAAGDFQRDALLALARTPKGAKLALGVVEGSFIRESGGVVELKTETGSIEIETGDIAPAALVTVARAAGSVDARTAAVFCLIEGDAAAAKSLVGQDALPERFWAYADKVARGPTEPARDMYQAALASLARPSTAADGVLRLQALLRERPDDLFVRRNKAAIATRAQGGRDFLFLAEDLKASGLFRPGKSGKLESCCTVDADVEPAKQKETFLDLEFSTLPDAVYKAWVLAGGCCQEVFDFSVQGTDMEAGKATKEPAEPGAAAAVQVKPYLPNVKKTHAQHNGPKQPSRWEWVQVPLPRYAKPGVQKLRMLADQKGFSVAAVIVSAVRSGPPMESELRELVRGRGERPKPAPPAAKAVPVFAMAMDGTDRTPVGALQDKALVGVPLFGLCFTGIDMRDIVTLPEAGELRFTYFLASPAEVTARIRIERDGSTIPCDIAVPSPVVGTPTEVRIPLGDFKPSFVKGPHLVPGETTRMIYIFSNKCDAGFRLNALSIVGIRK